MKQWPTYYYFLPYIILYFFFNNAGLPQGLLFTTLLTPVFLYFLFTGFLLGTIFFFPVLVI